jgi:hypothetical protein
MGDALVVTNGDQTDTIVEKNSFRDGCMARKFEPDGPNFTPAHQLHRERGRQLRAVHPEGRGPR